MYLSAMLKKNNHECEVFIDTETDNLVDDVLEYKPDIIGFSTMTTGLRFALGKAKQLKEHTNTIIIMGGPHPTFYPDVINEKCIDAICVGEGEYAIVDLANNIEKKKSLTRIKNIWFKKNGKVYKNDIRDLIDSPWEDVQFKGIFDSKAFYHPIWLSPKEQRILDAVIRESKKVVEVAATVSEKTGA